jgi:quercetin dioxygenase-like cupin family protein
MLALHLFPGADGESHFERIGPEALSEWAKAGANVVFIAGKPGFTDFHNSGRPHIAIVLAGKMELTASDGDKQVVGPGDCVFSEDTSGKGHSANVFDGEPFKVAIVTLAGK